MPNEFMRDAAVADETNGEALVFDDALVIAGQDRLDKLDGAVFGDFVFGLVTGTTSSLNTFEDVVGVDGSQYGEAWFDE